MRKSAYDLICDWLYNTATNPQQIEIQTPLVRLLMFWTCRAVKDLLWLLICCGFVVDLLYSLLYKKSTTYRLSGVWT